MDRSEKSLFYRGLSEFDSRTRLTQPNQWSDPTPDAEWTVRDLVNHLVSENLWVPELLAGKTIAQVGNRFDGDVLGENPLATWKSASAAAQRAVEKADLNLTVHLSYGDVPLREYLNQMFMDHLIHAWDLARALKVDDQLDAELVEACYQEMLNQAESWRQAGLFAAAVAVSDGADTQTKLLALTGRTP